MKMPKLFIRKKLRASTARRSLTASDEMDYEEMSEPNMKLSRALLIVLVLHVVAVAGIIAFNAMKSRQGAFPRPAMAASPAKSETGAAAPSKAEPVTVPLAATPVTKEERKAEAAKIPKALPVNGESGNFYIVAKGDNPVSIAKKLKVSQDDLLSVNHIDDPRKLQIGQKLIIPSKTAKPKKN